MVGGGRQAGLGIAAGGGVIAIDVAKVALPVNQRVALAEVLGHAHQRIVGSLVPVGMEAAEHIADDARALDRLGTTVA